MSRKAKTNEDMVVDRDLEERLEQSGELARLKASLEARLSDCGWKEVITNYICNNLSTI